MQTGNTHARCNQFNGSHFFIGKNISDDAYDPTRSWHILTITIEELAITCKWALLPEDKQYNSEYSYQFLVCAFFQCHRRIHVNDLFLYGKFGNQLVSYTRQMGLVRIRDQAKFENASLRTKHFRTWLFIFSNFAWCAIRNKSVWRVYDTNWLPKISYANISFISLSLSLDLCVNIRLVSLPGTENRVKNNNVMPEFI